ncbi:MAG: UDP-glucose 4-epimerase GalE [Candidatus Sulfotelmatobacter sp.]
MAQFRMFKVEIPAEHREQMMDKKRLSVLVVGGAGYIGSHAARELRRRGHNAIIYDNLCTGHQYLAEGFELIVGDISDAAKLNSVLQRVDAVMHFAAHAYVGESVSNPRKYFQNNVADALSLLNAVIDSGVRKFIFSSTCATYGIPELVPITEKTPRLPINPYGATKLAFENALEAYGHAYGLHFVSFRYFNAAGADESGEIGEVHVPETHLIPSAFEAIHGERRELEIFGTDYPTPDGTCIRDYIHVNDLAEAHVLGVEYLENGSSTALNLGTGQGSSVREVISTIERITSRRLPQRVAPRREGDPPQLVADPSLAQKVLGWKARRSLHDIVATAWKWDQSHRKSMAPTL